MKVNSLHQMIENMDPKQTVGFSEQKKGEIAQFSHQPSGGQSPFLYLSIA